MKKTAKILALILAIITVCSCFIGAAKPDWNEKYDTSMPDLNDGKWTETMNVDFTQIKNMDELREAKWAPSPHYKRNYEYWCPEMIEFTENGLIIHSEKETDHKCDVCEASEGVFTGGIETRISGENSEMLFEQAYGYYEATVIVPRGKGMWSAFWIQGDGTGKVGNGGKDGAEIDVYESSFGQTNPTKTGSAIHHDAYDYPWYKSEGNVTDMGYNLYDGKPHTYGLKWTPEEYVMYVDGTPVWASDLGGTSKVPEYLRLTVEIRDGNWGPYGQEIGYFENCDDDTNDFVIKNVKVYQNSDYTSEIKANEDYKDMKNIFIALIVLASVLAAALIILALVFIIKKAKAKKVK